MLILKIPDIETFDESTNSFNIIKGGEYRLEHSLVAIRKWESRYLKPFLSKEAHTEEELYAYFNDMSLDGPLPLGSITPMMAEEINNYMNYPNTATSFRKGKSSKSMSITAEVIYAQMVEGRVPFECQQWHINNLLTLLGVLNERANPKKMSRSEVYQENERLNEERRKKYKTRG